MLQVALNLKDAILEYYDNYPDNAYAGDGGSAGNTAKGIPKPQQNGV
jgi:hypothetical protein